MENKSTSTVRVASVADYDSTEDQELDNKNYANSAVKRTSQTNLTTCSDSGYSSLTQTTTSPVTDPVAAKPKSMAATESKSQTSPTSSRRRATESGSQQPQPATAPAPKKKIKIVQCKDPDCPECVAAREREQRGRKSNRRATISDKPTPAKSPVKKASSDTQPSRTARRPAPQPSQTPGVRRPSASTGARPKSMYDVPAKMMPRPMLSMGTYPAGGFVPPVPPGTVAIIERPSIGARGFSARKPRPVSITQLPDKLSARRTMQPSVILDSESEEEEEAPQQIQPPRKQRPMQRQVALRQRPVQATESESEFSSAEDDDDEEEDYCPEEEDPKQAAAIAEVDRRHQLLLQQQANAPAEMERKIAEAEARHLAETQEAHMRALTHSSMPPPPLPVSSMILTAPKYSMRTATGAPHITYGERRPSMHDHDELSRPSMREHSVGTSSTRRPSLASSGGTKATSYSHPNASGSARVVVEGNRRRRLSYVGAEDHHGLAAMHERFVQPPWAAPDFQTIIADAVRQQMERLQLSPSQTARTKMVDVDDRVQQALQYQRGIDASASRNLAQVPLTADALRRKQSDPSQTGSNRSSEDSFTRISAGHRLPAPSESGTMTVTGDEMTVRIDPDKGFDMEFEGRRVTLLPTADGAVELVIGGKRETTYTTRGSTINGSRVGGSKVGRTPTREREYAYDRASDFSRAPTREAMREVYREPRERDSRDREPRDREFDPPRERARARRDREDHRHLARERKQADYTDDESETENDKPPPPRARAGGRRRAETSWDDRVERAAPVRRPPPPAPRYSHRAERDDDYDDYAARPPQRRSRQEAPYAPGPVSSGYNGRGPKGPPSAVFGA
ncbi:hypothetical protein E2P81_ATG03283 [Venturia nashicola]|uniref:Uncharacterized protein n=1 Tax=Venturia nashicola TaxID=86259 RepID=A0A4Z1PN99_9PEZI|nr:hypothetical protein E6O75_ATG03350 [Venturia nashicola]TLD36394.1 hypothetical protein E2P81_ATG03283 [Venturia nashicola]